MHKWILWQFTSHQLVNKKTLIIKRHAQPLRLNQLALKPNAFTVSILILQRLTAANRTGGFIFYVLRKYMCKRVIWAYVAIYDYYVANRITHTQPKQTYDVRRVCATQPMYHTLLFCNGRKQFTSNKVQYGKKVNRDSDFWRCHAGKTAVHYGWYTLIFIYATIRLILL